MNILSIDVGITNLALASFKISRDFEIEKAVHCERCDIRHMCMSCTEKTCPLKHEKTTLDWVEHLLFLRRDVFEMADVILIERQPPGGLKDVEILLFEKLRERVKMINPRSLHGWMKITHLDYEARKVETEKLAEKYVGHTEAWENNKERRHDIADAVCFAVFYLNNLKNEAKRKEELEIFKDFAYDSFREDTRLLRYKNGPTFGDIWAEDKEYCEHAAEAWYLPSKVENWMSEEQKNDASFKEWVLNKKRLAQGVSVEEKAAINSSEPICIEDYAYVAK